MIVNHDKQSMPATASDMLMPLLDHPEYQASKLVIVEEAQFFTDLVPFVLRVVDGERKHCVVVGLDGDADRKPFGKVLDLIPYCDKVTKMTALCKRCADGTPALFSYAHKVDERSTTNTGEPCVGGEDRYIPLCRRHFLGA